MTERCCHCDTIKEDDDDPEDWYENSCSGEVMCSACYEEMYDYLTSEDYE